MGRASGAKIDFFSYHQERPDKKRHEWAEGDVNHRTAYRTANQDAATHHLCAGGGGFLLLTEDGGIAELAA